MRKTILSQSPNLSVPDAHWLGLDALASAEISSEDPSFPLENALSLEASGGWKAAAPGLQTIRLIFDRPQIVHRIRIEFRETESEREQEFVLYAITAQRERKELLRQQYFFSPEGSTHEIEDLLIELPDLKELELQIDPGRHDKQKVASLARLAIA